MSQHRELSYKQVDVFSKRIATGNPVAVVLADSDITAVQMLRIANWLNLSETVFVTDIIDKANYVARIFTPYNELPFAGHPTLGCAHALLEWGLLDSKLTEFHQHCGAGKISLSMKNQGANQDRLSLVSPPYSQRSLPENSHTLLQNCLPGIELLYESLIIDVGPRWLVTRLNHYQLHLYKPDIQAINHLSRQENLTGISLFAPSENGNSIYTRSFAPLCGVIEDPVCGSGNISVTAYLANTGQINEFGHRLTAHQGHELGRNGELYLHYDEATNQIHLGGNCITAIDGKFYI